LEQTILSAQTICKSFSNNGKQHHVLRNLDMDIYAGDFTVIMGPSGAGKTTLLYTLSGMEPPTLGNLFFQGEDISGYSEKESAVFRRKHCGFLFQESHFFENMSVTDNILVAGLLLSKNKKELYKKTTQLLEELGITKEHWNKLPGQLSGGQRQRVCLVRSLINTPPLLFADEPTGSLDSKSSTEVLDLLTKTHENGQTIVMVTHDISSTLRGNRILYLKDGMILDECILGKYEKQENDSARQNKLLEFLERQGW